MFKNLLILCLTLLCNLMIAQDTIFSTNGNLLTGLITAMDSSSVQFNTLYNGRKINTQINRSEIKAIRYHQHAELQQNAGDPYHYNIQLSDGSQLFGTIDTLLTDSLVFNNSILGKVSIPYYKISQIKTIDTTDLKPSGYWFPNPHATRHFFGPTAINLGKGEGYLQDIYVLLLSANFGLTDYLSIGGALTIIPGLGLEEQLYLLHPKIGFKTGEKFHAGGGVFYAHVTDIDLGILYAAGTYGSIENNITLGVGYGIYKDNFAQPPTFMVGGMYRVSRRISLITENWILLLNFTDYDPISGNEIDHFKTAVVGSYGMRFFGEQMAVDFGFFNLFSSGVDELFFPGIPYLDFVFKF